MSASALDAVHIEIMRASLEGIVLEMQNSLFRTGYSTIVRESQDASCAFMNARGEVVAQHVVLPLHIGSFPACCNAVIESYSGDIAEGDAFLINHPYHGGSPHAPDMCVITPVFHGGELIGFCGSIAHKSDIGGPVPGSCSRQAKEVFNEGLHLPAVRYLEALQARAAIVKEFLDGPLSAADVLLCPTVPIPVPTREEADMEAAGKVFGVVARLTALTRPFSYLGLPVLSIPMGLDSQGMPLGVQLVGRPFGEARLLAVAHALAADIGWRHPLEETST